MVDKKENIITKQEDIELDDIGLDDDNFDFDVVDDDDLPPEAKEPEEAKTAKASIAEKSKPARKKKEKSAKASKAKQEGPTVATKASASTTTSYAGPDSIPKPIKANEVKETLISIKENLVRGLQVLDALPELAKNERVKKARQNLSSAIVWLNNQIAGM